MYIKIEQYHNTYEYYIYHDNDDFILSIIGTDHIFDMSDKTFEIYNNDTRITCITNISNVELIRD